MIELLKVSAGYDGNDVVHDVDLEIKPGQITVLIGPNGSGKSTLLKTIVRIVRQSSGTILIDGKAINEFSSSDLAKEVAYLAQNKKAPDLSVLKMVLHGRFAYLKYPRKYSAKDIEIAKKALSWANMLEYKDTLVSKLSGGMQQKVYIAMALTQDADTILMDEPTTFLDIVHQLRLMEMAKTLANEGKAVVMVLHDLSQALEIADQVVVMKDGKILDIGSAEEIYQNKSIEEAFHVQLKRSEEEGLTHYYCRLMD